MIPEIGNLCLMLALALALTQSVVPLYGVKRQQSAFMAIAKPCAMMQFILLCVSFFCLMFAFVTSDFTVNYVAANSSISLPLIYRIGAAWGGHEGSLLLWLLMINSWTFILCLVSKHYPKVLLSQVLSVLGMINVGFLFFLLATSNPFLRNFVQTPLAGQDLNPLLQDPGLLLHPPMLYMGYVGFALVFAFAVAGLMSGRIDKEWASLARPWIILSWASLTLGILLGSWWAYHVLGWGGWWFWDPVENASLLPWLTGTALLHAVTMTHKRQILKGWTVILAILTFALSLLGTFLVRSGILISVHAFANDPTRGTFLLKYLCTVVIASLFLFALRAPKLQQENSFQFISRETFLLSGNVTLMVMMVTIMLGTLYPLALDILNLGKISVGQPYFNTVFIPLAIPLFLLMGVAPLCYWQAMPPRLLLKRLRLCFILAMGLAILLPIILTHAINAQIVLGLSLAFWIISTTLYSFYLALKNLGSIKNIPLHQYGMIVAHIGVAICIIGVSVVSLYSIEREIRIAPKESVRLGPYDFYFKEIRQVQGPNYQATQAFFNVAQKNKAITTLVGEQKIYDVQRMPMSGIAISPGFFSDLYLALGTALENDAWSVRLYYKPFIRWIWLGGLFMMLGGLIALLKRKSQRAYCAEDRN